MLIIYNFKKFIYLDDLIEETRKNFCDVIDEFNNLEIIFSNLVLLKNL